MSTDPAALLSATALTVFRLNSQLLEVSERPARPAELTAAWWQVLGAVVPEPGRIPAQPGPLARRVGYCFEQRLPRHCRDCLIWSHLG